MEAHKKKMLRYGRKQRKLEWRKKAVSQKKGWDETKKRKVLKSLDLAYMSSEEEINSDNETVFRIVPLPWRSEEFDGICQELDAKHDRLKSARSKRQMVKRVRGSIPSTRPKPSDVDDENSWVLKE
ncbi:hypothetical protein FSP39_011498 [Pinctada imbricata]|uniref:Uncharacterized protein n=1 Tax=Pinctada imbricata TaxID=66713 RepID=A0AA89CBS5_PINIB|nr:hypothetical protein FSP39_001098 [Pinctada imbricata]KAK3106040.1 hypothetical protein FSP39_011498 [Pinctada imbricata]